MVISPFKPNSLPGTNRNVYKGEFTEILYTNATYTRKGYVSVSRKFMMKDSSTGLSVFVKILYIFEIENKDEVNTREDLKKLIVPMKLKYCVTSGYDGVNEYGNVVYWIEDFGQNVSLVSQTSQNYNVFENKFNKFEYYKNERNRIRYVRIREEDPISVDFITQQTSHILDFSIKENQELNTFLSSFGNVKFQTFNRSLFDDSDTFSETNLLHLSYEAYVLKMRHPMSETEMNDMIVKKDMIEDFLGSLISSNLNSLIDNVTIIYDNGKINIPKFRNPFGKVVPKFIDDGMNTYIKGVYKSILPIEDMFGRIKIIVSIDDLKHSAFVRFKDFDDLNPGETIKITLNKESCMKRFFSEKLYGNNYLYRHSGTIMKQAEDFKNLAQYYKP